MPLSTDNPRHWSLDLDADRIAWLAYERGVRQYVVLGAGLDTFAYRNPHRGLKVFEVDHPDTQAWKRARLRDQSIAVPGSMRFAPVDFERQDGLLRGRICDDGIGFDVPAVLARTAQGLGLIGMRERLLAVGGNLVIASAPGQGTSINFQVPVKAPEEEKWL